MSIVQQINEGLQTLGFSQSLAYQLDQFIAFLGVLLVAYLADSICRKVLLKVVSRLIKQTKATWDDIVFDRKVRIALFQRTNKRLYILHILRNLIIHLLWQSNNNPLHRFFSHIFTDKVQKFMRRHRRQSICNQLHCIAHSYPSTLSTIIYCYYSAHGVQKYKKDASCERKRLFYSII